SESSRVDCIDSRKRPNAYPLIKARHQKASAKTSVRQIKYLYGHWINLRWSQAIVCRKLRGSGCAIGIHREFLYGWTQARAVGVNAVPCAHTLIIEEPEAAGLRNRTTGAAAKNVLQ